MWTQREGEGGMKLEIRIGMHTLPHALTALGGCWVAQGVHPVLGSEQEGRVGDGREIQEGGACVCR